MLSCHNVEQALRKPFERLTWVSHATGVSKHLCEPVISLFVHWLPVDLLQCHFQQTAWRERYLDTPVAPEIPLTGLPAAKSPGVVHGQTSTDRPFLPGWAPSLMLSKQTRLVLTSLAHFPRWKGIHLFIYPPTHLVNVPRSNPVLAGGTEQKEEIWIQCPKT